MDGICTNVSALRDENFNKRGTLLLRDFFQTISKQSQARKCVHGIGHRTDARLEAQNDDEGGDCSGARASSRTLGVVDSA